MKVLCIFWYEKFVALSAVERVSVYCFCVEEDRIIIRRFFFFIFCSVFLKSDRGALWKDRRAAFGPRAAFCFALLYTEPCPRRRIPNSAVELALDLGGPFTLCHRKIRNTFAWPPSCYFSHRNKSRLFYHILLPRKMTGP